MKEPDLSIPGWMLLGGAATLRERAFARVVAGLKERSIQFVHCPEVFEIYPANPSVQAILHSCASHCGARDALAAIPISRAPRSARSDPELVPMLQDLADIVAWEATEAFTARYYPGLPDIFVPEEHVGLVMEALQREMDREGKSRQKIPVSFVSLEPDRQRALAERRRWWYRKFSITPERWKTGTWSLWEVATEPMPELESADPTLSAVVV
jgi:hypothetical protein